MYLVMMTCGLNDHPVHLTASYDDAVEKMQKYVAGLKAGEYSKRKRIHDVAGNDLINKLADITGWAVLEHGPLGEKLKWTFFDENGTHYVPTLDEDGNHYEECPAKAVVLSNRPDTVAILSEKPTP